MGNALEQLRTRFDSDLLDMDDDDGVPGPRASSPRVDRVGDLWHYGKAVGLSLGIGTGALLVIKLAALAG